MIANIRRRVPRRARPKADMFHLPKCSHRRRTFGHGPIVGDLDIAIMPPDYAPAFFELYGTNLAGSGWYSYRWGEMTVFYKVMLSRRDLPVAPTLEGRASR